MPPTQARTGARTARQRDPVVPRAAQKRLQLFKKDDVLVYKLVHEDVAKQ